MKLAGKLLIAGAMVGACAIGWTARDVIGAERKAPAVMKRIYSGADGQSYVEDIPLDVNSIMEKVTKLEIKVGEPGNFQPPHVGPQRQYIINLEGSAEIEVANGKIQLPPGSIELIDDLTGKGHTTRVTSKERRVSLWLWFEDQKPHPGPMNR